MKLKNLNPSKALNFFSENKFIKDNNNKGNTILKTFKNPNNVNINNELNNNNTKSSTRFQLLENIAKPISNWHGLMFLQKKGRSQTKANYSFINYSFPYGVFVNQNEELLTPKYNTNKILLNNIYTLLIMFFKSMYCLISKPIFIFTQDKLKIQLFYFACVTEYLSFTPKRGIFRNKSLIENIEKIEGEDTITHNYFLFSDLTKIYPKRFSIICAILSRFFNKPVEFELIRLHKPYLDSNILINFLSLIINRRDLTRSINKVFKIKSLRSSFTPSLENSLSRKILLNLIENLKTNKNNLKTNNINLNNSKKLISTDLVNNWLGLTFKNKKNNLDYTYNSATESFLTGFNIKIGGRLRREPIIPKVTVKKFEKGFTAKGKINYTQMARFTHKNRKGAFSITIKSGQNF
jgi:hypothetical protein